MYRPSDDGADHNAEHGIAGDGVHEHAHAGRVLRRRQGVEQDMQRQQHQAEADRDAADVLDARARAAAEGDEADDEQHRRHRGDVERQDLDDQRGPDIGAEHDRERRNQADQAFGGERTRDQRGGGAALQQRGQADTGRECSKTVSQRARQQRAEIGTERAQDAALDHVQAPQQQRHATHQVEKNHASHDRPTLWDLSRKIRLSPNDSESIPLFERRAPELSVIVTVDRGPLVSRAPA
jgi:hypothetical protein